MRSLAVSVSEWVLDSGHGLDVHDDIYDEVTFRRVMSSLTVRFCSVCSKMLYFFSIVYLYHIRRIIYYISSSVVLFMMYKLCTSCVRLGEITVYLGKECLFELAPP